jgi:hypothetical protein
MCECAKCRKPNARYASKKKHGGAILKQYVRKRNCSEPRGGDPDFPRDIFGPLNVGISEFTTRCGDKDFHFNASSLPKTWIGILDRFDRAFQTDEMVRLKPFDALSSL